MKRHHYQGYSCQTKHQDLLVVSVGWSMIIIAGSIQAWCWSSRWELYVLIHRQQRDRNWAWCGHLKPQSPFTVYTSSNKDTPPNPSQTVPLIGHQAFKHTSLWVPFSQKQPQDTSVHIFMFYFYLCYLNTVHSFSTVN